ncbi:hypothetical protein AG1IA_03738 [Rhizoctonia solani AG-1 IA]|uniref:Uncharacterized protein n=1 Tax=Thanatephorus cucumeris (strain AG1-IA) TaxID=983506 RepID=L8WVW0_THACA|nr:hypothetical protein AG1IA_03738 [Rhizoctonia solani AG-1 IA]
MLCGFCTRYKWRSSWSPAGVGQATQGCGRPDRRLAVAKNRTVWIGMEGRFCEREDMLNPRAQCAIPRL